jgi:hypothetical protein
LVMFLGDCRDEAVIAAALAEKRIRTDSENEIAPVPQGAAIETVKSERKIRVVEMDPSEPLTSIGRRRKRVVEARRSSELAGLNRLRDRQ